MLHIRGMWVWFKLVLDCDGQPLTSVLLWRIWVVLVTTHFLIGVWELQFVTCESSRLLSQSSTVLTEALPFSWRWRFNQVKAKPIYLIDLDTSAQYDRKRKSPVSLFCLVRADGTYLNCFTPMTGLIWTCDLRIAIRMQNQHLGGLWGKLFSLAICRNTIKKSRIFFSFEILFGIAVSLQQLGLCKFSWVLHI